MKKDPEKLVFILSIVGTILGVVFMFWIVVQLKNVCEEIECSANSDYELESNHTVELENNHTVELESNHTVRVPLPLRRNRNRVDQY